MIARDLLQSDILPLTFSHTGKDAFYWMSDAQVRHLPVVHHGKLIRVLSDEDLFNHPLLEPLGTYDLSLYPVTFTRASDHLFEVMRLMSEARLTTIPVTDNEGDYLGLITQEALLKAFSDNATFAQPGGIITLIMAPTDYVLSTICRIVEEENARVLCTLVTSSPQSELLEVTIKINRVDISRITASLVRHGFRIKHTYGTDAIEEAYQDRYDALMHYLNM
jgi:CBS domain-containing protein